MAALLLLCSTVASAHDFNITDESNKTGEAIGLGLPSGIKWASCNVGATAPEEYGGYYAWGETEEKEKYGWHNYKWCDNNYTLTKYWAENSCKIDNITTLDPEDDVAHVKWGGNWRMPTTAEIEELRMECTWEWATLNGVIGAKITGPNGNSIFLPAAGDKDYNSAEYQGYGGFYWSNHLSIVESKDARALYFETDNYDYYGWDEFGRYYGHTVRPVYDDGSSTSIEIITPEANNENTIYDLRGQKLTEITSPGIYIANGKKVIVK